MDENAQRTYLERGYCVVEMIDVLLAQPLSAEAGVVPQPFSAALRALEDAAAAFYQAVGAFGVDGDGAAQAPEQRLWLLRRVNKPGAPIYDCADGFVVRAPSEPDARGLAAQSAGDEGADVWLSAEFSACHELQRAGDPEVVLHDFNAG